MNITLLNQYYAPDEAATAQVLADLGSSLAAEGHAVTAICGDRAYADPSRRYPRREVIDAVAVKRIPITGFGRSSALGRSTDYGSFVAGATVTMLRGPRPDVIISLTTPPMIALAGAFAARVRGAKALLWSMDVYPDLLFALGALRERSALGRALRLLSRMTIRSQHIVVALGESMAERLRANGAHCVQVVHNWSDESAIVPVPTADSALRGEWGWQNRFVVLYSGNLGRAHDFDTVLHAAQRLRREREIHFAFVGAGPQLAYVQRRREEMELQNVEIRPPVSRDLLNDNLAAGDVHLVTMKDGAPGLLVPSKIYGILAAGRPAIYVGPAKGEVFEIISSGRCGTHVAIGDADGVAAAIRRYQCQPALREEEGRRARELFEERFTKRRAMAEFRGILESLSNAKAPVASTSGARPSADNTTAQ